MRLTSCDRNGEIIPEIQNTTIGNSGTQLNSFIVSIDAKWSGLHRQSALCALLYKKSALKLFRAYLKFDYCIILSSNGIFSIHFAALSTQKQGKLLISLSFAIGQIEMQR